MGLDVMVLSGGNTESREGCSSVCFTKHFRHQSFSIDYPRDQCLVQPSANMDDNSLV